MGFLTFPLAKKDGEVACLSPLQTAFVFRLSYSVSVAVNPSIKYEGAKCKLRLVYRVPNQFVLWRNGPGDVIAYNLCREKKLKLKN